MSRRLVPAILAAALAAAALDVPALIRWPLVAFALGVAPGLLILPRTRDPLIDGVCIVSFSCSLTIVVATAGATLDLWSPLAGLAAVAAITLAGGRVSTRRPTPTLSTLSPRKPS